MLVSLISMAIGSLIIGLTIKLVKTSRKLMQGPSTKKFDNTSASYKVFLRKWEGFHMLFMGFKPDSFWT